jgi:hypothetical protein
LSPFYGSKDPPHADAVPDWLLGGNRKRRVLASLSDPDRERGWTVAELVEELACGRSTVFEIVRGLRAIGVLSARDGRIRLDFETKLGAAIAELLAALEPFAGRPVDRPPRQRRRRR